MAGRLLKQDPATQPQIAAELAALEKIVLLLELSDDCTRRRIMAYLNSRYPFYRWPI